MRVTAVSDLTSRELVARLHDAGLLVRTGAFDFRIISPIASVAEGIGILYADYPVLDSDEWADFTVRIEPGKGVHRIFRRQARFVYDGESPFVPMPIDHAFPLLEWAMNWCISGQVHHCLTLHSAAIERDGLAVIMPAPPGSGKSTLCAALVARGWRLLSDELALIALTDGTVLPLCRPISLKNESLAVIRSFAPDAVLNRVTHDTLKGSVSHMKVPSEHVARVREPARPRWVVFPKFIAGAPARLVVRSKADSLLELARNSFNYPVLGLQGFNLLADMVGACDCFDFSYGRLDDAIQVFDTLASDTKAGHVA